MTSLYYTLFNFVALSVVIYTGIDVFYRIVRSELRQVHTTEIVMQQAPDVKRQKTSPLSDFDAVTDRNLFGSREKGSSEEKTEEIDALEPTSLKIALLGTVTGSKEHAFAVIEESDKKKQGLYKVGDSVKDAEVKRILRGKVILRVREKDEILTMEEPSSSKKEAERSTIERGRLASRAIGGGATIVVSRKDVESSLKNINELMTQVRIRPHFRDGKADGLSISRIRRDSIFTKLGLRNGDVVQGINGKPIASPDDVMEIYEQLNTGAPMSLQINRRNQPRTINYRFR